MPRKGPASDILNDYLLEMPCKLHYSECTGRYSKRVSKHGAQLYACDKGWAEVEKEAMIRYGRSYEFPWKVLHFGLEKGKKK